MSRRALARIGVVLAILAAALVLRGFPHSRESGGGPEDQRAAAVPGVQVATFAGGCFWCMQPPFDHTEGVISTVVGYTGGRTENPTYEEVSYQDTGHAESIQVTFDPARVSYEQLLDVFWHNIDPLARDRQFCDVGAQYRSAIFTHDETQQRLALESKKKLEESGRFSEPIATQIVPASAFYPAEDYHQEYYRKNPIRYKFYRFNCGRDQRLRELWGS